MSTKSRYAKLLAARRGLRDGPADDNGPTAGTAGATEDTKDKDNKDDPAPQDKDNKDKSENQKKDDAPIFNISVVQPKPAKRQPTKSAEAAINKHWDKFKKGRRGRPFSVLPFNPYSENSTPQSYGTTRPIKATRGFDEAVKACKAKVEKISKECRRINQKYRDFHFDLEMDLLWQPPYPDPDPVPLPADGPLPLVLPTQVKGPPPRYCLDGLEYNYDLQPKSVKRVEDIFEKPEFFKDGVGYNDVRQGHNGDCWFLAAVATVTCVPNLIERVCVARDEEVGIYGFVFYRDGEWVSSIVDDQLYLNAVGYYDADRSQIYSQFKGLSKESVYQEALLRGSDALYFGSCVDSNETWLPLLEKAYAKAHGDYAAIEGGWTGEGVEDLTGGVTSEIQSSDILSKDKFWREQMLRVNKDFLFAGAFDCGSSGWGDEKDGVIGGHAYSVLRAVDMDGQRLVLVRNPWGESEWKGAWSDGSKEWTAEWFQKLEHKFGDDGCFWMSYKDFLRIFTTIDRTRLFNDDWSVTSAWIRENVEWENTYSDSRFQIDVPEKCMVVIVLQQLDTRYFRGLEGEYDFSLHFRLHNVESHPSEYVLRSKANVGMTRSVSCECELEKGKYDVVFKIHAEKTGQKSVDKVVEEVSMEKRKKFLWLGMSYDLAHAKGAPPEAPEEKKDDTKASKDDDKGAEKKDEKGEEKSGDKPEKKKEGKEEEKKAEEEKKDDSEKKEEKKDTPQDEKTEEKETKDDKKDEESKPKLEDGKTDKETTTEKPEDTVKSDTTEKSGASDDKTEAKKEEETASSKEADSTIKNTSTTEKKDDQASTESKDTDASTKDEKEETKADDATAKAEEKGKSDTKDDEVTSADEAKALKQSILEKHPDWLITAPAADILDLESRLKALEAKAAAGKNTDESAKETVDTATPRGRARGRRPLPPVDDDDSDAEIVIPGGAPRPPSPPRPIGVLDPYVRRPMPPLPRPLPPGIIATDDSSDSEDDAAAYDDNCWNAVAVVGLRVYSHKQKVNVEVIRPQPESESKKEEEKKDGEKKDDAAKDGEEKPVNLQLKKRPTDKFKLKRKPTLAVPLDPDNAVGDVGQEQPGAPGGGNDKSEGKDAKEADKDPHIKTMKRDDSFRLDKDIEEEDNGDKKVEEEEKDVTGKDKTDETSKEKKDEGSAKEGSQTDEQKKQEEKPEEKAESTEKSKDDGKEDELNGEAVVV